MSTTSPQLDRSVTHPAAETSLRFDWAVAGLSVWFIGGLFLDGWAHHHLPGMESFITPWHGVLYSGFLAVAAVLVARAVRTRIRSGSGVKLLPAGYEFALVGVLLFGAGGVGDFAWHTLFGIEVSIEALLSPTHLVLALGGGLMLSGPVRAAWRRADPAAAPSWAATLPSIVSYTLLLSVLTFFTQFANPLVESWTFSNNHGANRELNQELGISALIVTTTLITGAVLLATRSVRLPFGAMTLMLGVNAAGMSVFRDQYLLIPAGVLAGLAADLLIRRVAAGTPRAFLALGAVVPAVFVATLLAILALSGRLDWSIHLWAGSIVVVAVLGGLLALLASRTGTLADRT